MRKYLTIKDHAKEERLYQQRAVIALGFVITLLLTLVARLYFLQIHKNDTYTTLADNNRVNVVPVAPNRGLIYDRYGQLLADNQPTFSLEIVPEQVENLQQTLEELRKILDISAEDLAYFNAQRQHKRRFEGIPIRMQLSEKELAAFAVNRHRIAGVDIAAGLIRHYPLQEKAAHALGYVSRISEAELKKLDATNYSATQFIGKVGVEKTYEAVLHGKVGHQHVESNARGRVVRILDKKLPTPGKNLHLTLDKSLQEKAMAVLDNKRGAIIAMDPRDGAIRALASNPSYDPNLFVTGLDNTTFQSLQHSTDRPLFNRALRGQYPPGSTIKPLLGLFALDHAVIASNDRIFDPGWFQLNNDDHQYRDWRRKGHGWINLREAIEESCSTFFYELAHKMGIETIDQILSEFGFGAKTNIDIHSEAEGLVPSPAWKRQRLKQAWFPGETLITGIGQGYTLVTPIQLAQATAVLANKGFFVQPHIVDFIEDSKGQRLYPFAEPSPHKPLSVNNAAAWQEITSAMRGVTDNPRGTAYWSFRGSRYKVAAKTGTAQVSTIKQGEKYNEDALAKHLRDHSLFISYAPINNPELLIVIITENEKGSPRLARRLYDHYFSRKNVS